MKTSATLVLAASALASAQVTYNATTGQYICSRPNSAFCAGDSFATDIIIRCDANGRGQPGRCTNNLAGQFPLGVNPSLCWMSQPYSGDAACEKNCVVYASPSPFQLPPSVCTPYASGTGTGTGYVPRPTYPIGPPPRSSGNGTMTSTAGPSRPTGTGGGGGTGGGPAPSGNGTAPTSRGGGGGGGGGNGGGGSSGRPTTATSGSSPSGTRTPIPPSGTITNPTSVPTAAAVHNSVGSLVVAGIVAAYFI
ncbi:hypothetical protein CABS01_05816 [Colletotrichum abscissum]|uniref:Uncharacterized protein n=1 Tax=Colletotrichum abscissum TaxID=1671311 RepID=A0A9Q0AZC6_9PEZI|nr:uncharacterized protein CABS01_05816 [Colletotrichum abscissum]KAI3534244.1 hypothetical protein CABS02_13322 [Colletotrichum abscissum]KAK1518282.1 hypothetical protein CABS01_05816 [Colletotrichum abscissum]